MCPPYPRIGMWGGFGDIDMLLLCDHDEFFMLKNMMVCRGCMDFRLLPLNWEFV